MKSSFAVSILVLGAQLATGSPPQATSPEEIARSELVVATEAYLTSAIKLAGRYRDAGRYSAARQVLEAALEEAGGSDDERAWRARLFNQVGRTHVRERQFGDARSALERSISLVSEGEDELTRGSALNALGGCLLMEAGFELAEGQAEAVRALHLQALAISEHLSGAALSPDELRRSRINLAEAHFNLGLFDERSGADPAAEAHFLKGLEAAELAGHRISMAFCLRHLGGVAERSDRLADAERFYAASLLARREAGNASGAGFAFASLARFLSEKKGDHAGARSLLTEGLGVMKQAGNRSEPPLYCSSLPGFMKRAESWLKLRRTLADASNSRKGAPSPSCSNQLTIFSAGSPQPAGSMPSAL